MYQTHKLDDMRKLTTFTSHSDCTKLTDNPNIKYCHHRNQLQHQQNRIYKNKDVATASTTALVFIDLSIIYVTVCNVNYYVLSQYLAAFHATRR